MEARVVQVNVSDGGLPKHPVDEAWVDADGLRGDRQRNLAVHGGPLQAVCLFARETLNELVAGGYPLHNGSLGENLTTRGLEPAGVRLGDVYHVGEAVHLQITKPRAPCRNLHRFGTDLPRRIWGPDVPWGTSGFYARVLAPGRVRPGDPIRRERQGPDPAPRHTRKDTLGRGADTF